MARKQIRRFQRKQFEDFTDKLPLVGEVLMFYDIETFSTHKYGESVSIKVARTDGEYNPTGEPFRIAASSDSALARNVTEALREIGEPFVAVLRRERGDSGYWYYFLDEVDSESEAQ